ncbi:LysR family transcriptional regulator [Catenulispora sp. NF23]|uniref:LysR family transcriptional regulator n=1 Tax=Catenulispora pinistramenti TaxID=2705254 RepID=UPI001BACBA4E|nr:LysR family transcriptional regulator [Catenulispora pinistramenti]MBS2539121.1 LysR family transcriptional regulator [Catenulispora pinistramenti]
MELRHLRYFAAVVSEGSLSRAADRLHITQPSLSRQIRQLEREVGAKLLDRSASGTKVTDAGAALHHHALVLLRLADATTGMVRSAINPASEAVHMGIPQGIADEWLLRLLAVLEAQVPRATVAFTETSSADQLTMLREGRLDLGIVREHPTAELNGRHLFDTPLGIALRPGHHLADKPACRLGDLDALRVLAHGRGQVPVVGDRLVIAAHDAGAVPHWHFAQFSEHALACAEAAKADAVLLIEHSARRLLPQWPWRPLTEPEVPLFTWLAWPTETRVVVRDVAQVVIDYSREEGSH